MSSDLRLLLKIKTIHVENKGNRAQLSSCFAGLLFKSFDPRAGLDPTTLKLVSWFQFYWRRLTRTNHNIPLFNIDTWMTKLMTKEWVSNFDGGRHTKMDSTMHNILVYYYDPGFESPAPSLYFEKEENKHKEVVFGSHLKKFPNLFDWVWQRWNANFRRSFRYKPSKLLSARRC